MVQTLENGGPVSQRGEHGGGLMIGHTSLRQQRGWRTWLAEQNVLLGESCPSWTHERGTVSDEGRRGDELTST
jgi:hypothetical protein